MASMAYVVAAMWLIFTARASCRPTGRPHWTRSADQPRATFRHHLDAATHIAGSDRRPVFSVVSAIFRPRPSPLSTFSAGTKTSWKRVTEFSMPRSPMNALRFSTVMPGESASTTNAVMPPRWPSVFSTRAITTSRPATVPFVAHSLTPLMR